MVKNNIELDVKSKVYRERHHSSTDSGRYPDHQIICESYHQKQDGVVNNTFIKMMEALGYDIELTYVKREV